MRRFFRGRLEGLEGSLEIVKFKGGQSNQTYRISSGGRSFVLRRRPPGQLLESAHAIDRECRVLSALTAATFAVPQPRFYCEDAGVIGCAFRTASNEEMNVLLARLRALDYGALGLGDSGKTAGYAARNLARWSK